MTNLQECPTCGSPDLASDDEFAAETCRSCGWRGEAECPWEATDGGECATMREREVAGASNDIPPCPLHGDWPGDAQEPHGLPNNPRAITGC